MLTAEECSRPAAELPGGRSARRWRACRWPWRPGYLLARCRFLGKWLVEVLVDLPLVLPPVVTGYLLLVAFGPHGPIGSILAGWFGVKIVFTWLGAALASAVVSFPLMVRAIRLAFQGVDPRLEMAARSLGASRLAAFFTVPAAGPAGPGRRLACWPSPAAWASSGPRSWWPATSRARPAPSPWPSTPWPISPTAWQQAWRLVGLVDPAGLRGLGGQRVARTEADRRCRVLNFPSAATAIPSGFGWILASTWSTVSRRCSGRRAAARRASSR